MGSSANTELPAGWYVVSGSDVNYSGFLKCESGDIHLILADGAKLTIGDGLIGDDNLTIYGQSGGTGQLVVTSVDKQPIQTLGGLTINGGNINVSTTNNNRNAIQAGANGVTINGGTISATIPNSYSNFYGILTEGAITLGWRSTSDRITVTNYYAMGGVKVKAGQAFMNNDAAPAYLSGTISDMTLIDGKTLRAINPADFELTATNEYTIKSAAGWDVFCDLLADYDNGIFSGKTVKLEKNIEVSRMAGSDKHDFSGNFDGAGHKMTVNISGTSNHIAPFFYLKPQGDNASVTIQNLKVEGTVNAGAKYAGGIVGGCEGTVNIINCVSDVTINSSISGDGTHGGLVGRTTGSGTLNIEGCAFTGKLLTSNGTIKCGGLLGWKSGTGSLNISNSLYAPAEIENGETEVSAEESATFARNGGSFSNSYYTRTLGTEQGAHAYSTATLPLNIGAEVKDYGFVKAYANGVKFNDLYYMVPEAVSLANAEENDVEGKDGYFANVTLTGRTLTKDNAWNTLCLPFCLSAGQIEDSPLAGAVIREMDSSTNLSSNGVLTLNFKDAKSIEAGKAYIVKWTTTGENITEPVFNAVSIENADLTGTESTDGNVKFVGQYSPFAIDESNINSILFIGSNNKIGYSKNPRQLKSCRAHFWVRPNGDAAAARSISVDFGDGVTTSINFVEADNANTNTADGIYTIDGRRVKGEMMQKGVYVVKGKKVVK